MGWQRIETAPKDNPEILLGFAPVAASDLGSTHVGHWHDGSANHWEHEGWYFLDDDILTSHPCHPTHWQPLPDPPTK